MGLSPTEQVLEYLKNSPNLIKTTETKREIIPEFVPINY